MFYKNMESKGETINKYKQCLFELDNEFSILKSVDIKILQAYNDENNVHVCTWIRDIYEENDELCINLEKKTNIGNTRYKLTNYKIRLNSFDSTNNNIIAYENENYFLFSDKFHVNLGSLYETDKNDPDFFWGIYLFLFKCCGSGNEYRPKFDRIVDYDKDKGHLIHNFIKVGDDYLMLFSIRHQIKYREFEYRIYTAKTHDFLNFYETTEIISKVKGTNWLSYPHLFKFQDEYYMVSNQDDFGKEKELLLFSLSDI